MATATESKPKLTPATALAEFEKRQKLWDDAEQNVSDLSRELADLLTRTRQLHDERRKLAHRSPDLVNHLGHPVGKADNPIREIDKALNALDDLGEAQAKVDHARALANSKKQATADYAAAHAPLIRDGRRAQREELTVATNAAIAAARDHVAAYLNANKGEQGFSALAGRNPREVPGYEHSADLTRILNGFTDLPVPLPEAE